MDYAFVPGVGDVALDVLRAVLALRPQTGVVRDPTAATVDVFIGALDVAVELGLDPAGDLIVGSHGSAEGELQLSLDPANPSPTTYETLERVNTSRSINVPSDLGTANTSFRLAGCLIGSDACLPFLRLLKQALGPVKNVSAPRYIHGFTTTGDGSSAFEYMLYAHRIMFKEPLTTRDAVVGKFDEADLKQDLDGTDVPGENWDKWVPKAGLNLAPATFQEISFDFPVKISPAAGGMTTFFKDVGVWYSVADHFTLKAHITGTIPGDEAGQVALVPLLLEGATQFEDTHPFPIFRRFHFTSKQAFIDGLKWKPTVSPGNFIQLVGTRYRYELHVPIFKPGTTDELIYNYYPVSGAPVINFTEANAPFKLFGVV